MPTGHAKATIGDVVIAETDSWEEVEGNVYFPPSSVKNEYLSKTNLSTNCPWKGDASYYTIKVDGKHFSAQRVSYHGQNRPDMYAIGQELQNAAWYYPTPKDKAENIRDYVAFCTLRPCSSVYKSRALPAQKKHVRQRVQKSRLLTNDNRQDESEHHKVLIGRRCW